MFPKTDETIEGESLRTLILECHAAGATTIRHYRNAIAARGHRITSYHVEQAVKAMRSDGLIPGKVHGPSSVRRRRKFK